MPLNRQGVCPNCQQNWDGGDVQEEIAKLDLFIARSPTEVSNLAQSFGWTPFNKVRFSKLTVIETTEKILYQCPNILCMHVFDGETEEEFESIVEAKRGKVITVISSSAEGIDTLGNSIVLEEELNEEEERQQEEDSIEEEEDNE